MGLGLRVIFGVKELQAISAWISSLRLLESRGFALEAAETTKLPCCDCIYRRVSSPCCRRVPHVASVRPNRGMQDVNEVIGGNRLLNGWCRRDSGTCKTHPNSPSDVPQSSPLGVCQKRITTEQYCDYCYKI
jgi:hypothetical protein